MAKVDHNNGGGTATHAGTNYQNRVAAWTAVQILAEQSAVPPWDLPTTVTLESLHAETPHAVDDLGVKTSAGGSVRSQAKHTLSLQSSPDSPFGSAVSQCVREFRANPLLDATRDRLVIVTTSLSSGPIKTHLPAFLTRFRSSSMPEEEWAAGNSQENDAAATLKEHLYSGWRTETGADPSTAEIDGMLKLLRIQILDVDEHGLSEREAKQLLRMSVLVEPTQADAAWNVLITAMATYAANSQRADRTALQRVLTDAGIAINAARSFQDDIGRLKEHTAATLRSLAEYSHIQVGSTNIVIERAAASDLQSAASVDRCRAWRRSADMPSTHNLLIRLEQFGHKLLAHFHSHPEKGADATKPSGTDENFQKRLESAGHLAIMAIFSRDGFVRFVRLDQNFEIEIYGEGVENHAPGIYHLKNID